MKLLWLEEAWLEYLAWQSEDKKHGAESIDSSPISTETVTKASESRSLSPEIWPAIGVSESTEKTESFSKSKSITSKSSSVERITKTNKKAPPTQTKSPEPFLFERKSLQNICAFASHHPPPPHFIKSHKARTDEAFLWRKVARRAG